MSPEAMHGVAFFQNKPHNKSWVRRRSADFFFFLLQGSSIVSEGTSSRDPLFASLGLAACDQRLEAPKALGLRNMSGNDPTHVHFQTSVVSIWGAVSVFLTKRRLFEHFFTPVSTTISHLLFRTCTYSYCCCVLLFASPIGSTAAVVAVKKVPIKSPRRCACDPPNSTRVNAVLCP